MVGTRKRKMMGMFDYAKYSKPVLRSIPDSVQKAVSKDINRLLDYDAAAVRFRRPAENDDHRTQTQQQGPKKQQLALNFSVVDDSLAEQEAEEQEESREHHQPRKMLRTEKSMPRNIINPPIILASAFLREKQSEHQLSQGRDPTFSAVRDVLLKAAGDKDKERERTKEKANMDAKQRIAMLLKPTGAGPSQLLMDHHHKPTINIEGVDFLARTPPPSQTKGHHRGAKNNNNDEGSKGPMLPDKCPLESIAAHLMDSFPHITLRNNEPQTLTDATFALAKRALLAASERQEMAEGKEKDQTLAESTEMNPFKTLSNQTMCLIPSYLKDAFHTTDLRDLNNSNFELDGEYEDDEVRCGRRRKRVVVPLDESPTADLQDEFLFPTTSNAIYNNNPISQNLSFDSQLIMKQSSQSSPPPDFSTQGILSSDFGGAVDCDYGDGEFSNRW